MSDATVLAVRIKIDSEKHKDLYDLMNAIEPYHRGHEVRKILLETIRHRNGAIQGAGLTPKSEEKEPAGKKVKLPDFD